MSNKYFNYSWQAAVYISYHAKQNIGHISFSNSSALELAMYNLQVQDSTLPDLQVTSQLMW